MKKSTKKYMIILSVTVTLAILLSATSGVLSVVKRYYGDIDNNGFVETDDARLILRATVGLEPAFEGDDFIAADVDKNGYIETDDARSVLRMTVGLEERVYIESSGLLPDTSGMAESVNAMRTAASISELVFDNKLTSAAAILAEDLFVTAQPEMRSNDTPWFTAIKQSGLKLQSADACFYSGSSGYGVALAALNEDADAVQLLKNGDYTHIGIACYEAPDGFYYWCLLLAKY